MEIFHMTDIIPLLPLESPPRGKSAYYVPCPHCDRRGRKKDRHLNINLTKDVYRCALCGWNGGIFDLYAYYTGTSRDNVRDELIRRLGKGDTASKKERPYSAALPSPPEITTSPAADIEVRHTAYNTLLSMLTLAGDHKLNLLGRGLSESVIINNGYKTTPMVGGKIIAKRLLESGCLLEGVPGFYKDKTGVWTFIENRRGIIVPVRDIQGRIQGMQVRRDNEEKRKYRWVSSAGIETGCGAESWVHLAGPVRERIILSEGPMKADVIFHLTGQTVLAVPGVNALKHLERSLADLTELGVKRVTTAFDMDFLKNPHVQNGYAELVNLLRRVNLQFGTYLWRPDYNGLDDYVWECCLGHVRDS